MKRKILGQILMMCCLCMLLVLGMHTEAQAKTRINKTSAKIYIHDTEDLRILDSSGNVVSGYVKWTSSKPNVAYVDIYGRVYGVKAGTTTITAKYGNRTYRCTVTVSNMQDVYASRLVHYINYERAKYGLPPLQKETELNKAAEKRSKEIAVRFRTTRLNNSSPFSAISVHYPWKKASQLIARKYLTPKATVEAWSKNKSQHAIICKSGYNKVGTACYMGKDGHLYWVAFLAKK